MAEKIKIDSFKIELTQEEKERIGYIILNEMNPLCAPDETLKQCVSNAMHKVVNFIQNVIIEDDEDIPF